jgi:hypothetical protein
MTASIMSRRLVLAGATAVLSSALVLSVGAAPPQGVRAQATIAGEGITGTAEFRRSTPRRPAITT